MSQQPAPTTSPWVRRADSCVHGCGLFAAKDIPKGTRVIEYVGERITKAESDRRDEERRRRQEAGKDGNVYLFELNRRHDIDGAVSWNTARLINHSCDPNCEAASAKGGIYISALRAIAEGEELNYDYGFDWDNWQEHSCRCGAPTCCGYIIKKSQRWRVRKAVAAQRAEQSGPPAPPPRKSQIDPLAQINWGNLMRLKARMAGGKNRSLAVAESLTSGQLQSRIGMIPGASDFFKGGITAYTIDVKVAQLGVNRLMAEACRAVSENIAIQMAKGAARLFGASVGAATTGYAEPSPAAQVVTPFAWWAIAEKGRRGQWIVTTGKVMGKGLPRAAMQAKVADKVVAGLIKQLKPVRHEGRA